MPRPHRVQARLPAARAHVRAPGGRDGVSLEPASHRPRRVAVLPPRAGRHRGLRHQVVDRSGRTDGFFPAVWTSRGSRLACMFVRCAPDAPFTLLFSHGNAVDLGQMSSFYLGLGTRLGCNVFSYDYSGYGGSSGKPSEKNLYADIEAAWHVLRNRYAVLPENIILYGQSIGTVPTVDLASRYECAAIVLHSPLMSGMRVAFPNTRRTYCFDAFPSIDKISQVSSPVLVIHGTEDEVIDFSHGLAMYERCQRAVEPLWVEGAGHNDVELYGQYLERLKRFVTQELPQRSVP
ncbi:alpha/beta hydrolase domain-containing protein 17C-like isoform X2 [Petromyzon marinus]|uniref:palmitoyl-protein hydrolase n=1 Tax=Petromyzon marinus TaxID=7757 RepID=A0AAJ7SUQ0_PETMA|nr:alpha/beta hydrolase domain-containing protein 17C-like isoform X2 [Petromyzon marinus]